MKLKKYKNKIEKMPTDIRLQPNSELVSSRKVAAYESNGIRIFYIFLSKSVFIIIIFISCMKTKKTQNIFRDLIPV